MSISGAHADAFFQEVLREGRVWAIRDAQGIPAPRGTDGVRAMPFWSLATRAEKIIATVDAYAGFTTVDISMDEWRSRWLPGLERDGLLLGLNWAGARATGYDVEPASVLASFAAREASSSKPSR